MHALPVLAGLRARYPEAHLAWLVGTPFAPLLEGHPLLDEVIPFDRKRYGKMWRSAAALRAFLRFAGDLRRRRFDLVVDLQGLFRSAFLSWVSGAAERVGFAGAREAAWIFYSRRVHCPDQARHAVERNLCVAEALGLSGVELEFPLGLRSAEHDAARSRLAEAAGRSVAAYTAIIPGARWATKRWSVAGWAALIDRLHEAALPPCVLLGSPSDRALADDVKQRCHAQVVDLTGRTTLRELAALLDLADLVICHDSGPMHIAAALDTPVVAIFGPTDPACTGPYSARARVVRPVVDCWPCRLRECGHHTCLRDLSVETVFAEVQVAAEAVLGRSLCDGAGSCGSGNGR